MTRFKRLFVFTALIPLPAFAQVPHTPKDLSPLGMFLAADMVVKAVMLGLVVASIATWTVFFAKSLELGNVARALRQERDALGHFAGFSGLAGAVSRDWPHLARIVVAVQEEMAVGLQTDRAGVKERIAARLAQIDKAFTREAVAGAGLLATIGSVAPFVGLFGTVWGIMNSFIGISKAQTTNLAVVAPGIAEALLATAIGLVAAIPAVVIYNHLVRRIQGLRGEMSALGQHVAILAAREIDTAGAPSLRPQKVA